MYEFLLFDADDTIYDFQICEKLSMEETWGHFNLPLSEENVKSYMKHNHDAWKDYEKGLITPDVIKVRRFERFFAERGITNIDPLEITNYFIQRLGEHAEKLPDSVSVLEELKKRGYKLYIITNGLPEVQVVRFGNDPLGKLFDDLFTTDRVKSQKPKKEYFDAIFNELKINDKKKVCVIGDSLTSDIQGGINAGVDTIWFNPKDSPSNPNIQPTKTISKFTQLLDIFPPLH